MKNAAFVKMRDSVSFCKQILIEYVLKDHNGRRQPYIPFRRWSVHLFPHGQVIPEQGIRIRWSGPFARGKIFPSIIYTGS